MKKFLIFALMASTIIACAGGEDAPKKTKKKESVQLVKKVDGEKVYKTYCVTCHGLKGNMGGSGAFDLTTSELGVKERIAVITNGRGAMTPFKGLLNEEKIEAVAKYSMKLTKKAKKDK